MRVSDWSSAVCSSDLAAVAGHRQAVVVAESRNLDAGELAGLQDRQALCDLDLLAVDRQLRHRSPPTPPPLWIACARGCGAPPPDIGSASCRESVGQYG